MDSPEIFLNNDEVKLIKNALLWWDLRHAIMIIFWLCGFGMGLGVGYFWP